MEGAEIKRIRLELGDGTSETYDVGEVKVVTMFIGKFSLEDKINQAIIYGGIFEVPAPPGHSLIQKIKINSRAVKKVTLLSG